MRTILLALLLTAPSWTEGTFGTWKMNPVRSAFRGDAYPKSLTLRIEPHVKGEVFTIDTIYGNGQTTTSSTILYFDDRPRDFQGPNCSGTQSSRRVDSRTVEIMNKCANGDWTRFVRRLAGQSKELTLEITEQHPDGRRLERRLTLEKK